MKKMGFFALLFLTGCGTFFGGTEEANVSTLNMDNCWACSVYVICFNALGALLQEVFSNLTANALTLTGVALLLWLGFYILRVIGAPNAPDIKKTWTTIMTVFFKAVIVMIVLWQGGDNLIALINATMTPLVQIIISLGKTLFYTGAGDETFLLGTCNFDFDAVIGVKENGKDVFGNYPFFTKSLAITITELIFRLNVILGYGWFIGQASMTSINPLSLITGGSIFIINFLLIFSIPFMFLDSFLRIGGTLILSPFLMISWIFPESKGYIAKAVKVLVGGLIQLFLLCIVMGLFGTILIAWDMLGFSNIQFSNGTVDMHRFLEGNIGTPLLLLLLYLCMYTTIQQIPKLSKYFEGDGTESVITANLIGGLKIIANTAMIGISKAFGNKTDGMMDSLNNTWKNMTGSGTDPNANSSSYYNQGPGGGTP